MIKLLIYIEPTPYLIQLWREIGAKLSGTARIVFLEENLSQDWGLDLGEASDTEVLRGGRLAKAMRLLRLISRSDVDLLHLAGWGHPLLLLALLNARLRRIPVTMETDTPLPVGLPFWKGALKKLLYPMLFTFPARFLPGGSRQATYLRHYGVGVDRIVIANMTVDVTAISHHVVGIDVAQRVKIRERLGLPVQATVFLYVGRMEPHKGVEELLEAFGRLPADVPIALLLVGDGPMREVLNKAANTDSRIRWTGRLSGSALLDVYAVVDVFVLPSRFEPWGLVVNEAMAAGLPVIASERVGCVDDLVIQGKTGLLVPAEDPAALGKAMETLLVDARKREDMTQQARELIAGWTLANEAKIMVRTWQEVLAD